VARKSGRERGGTRARGSLPKVRACHRLVRRAIRGDGREVARKCGRGGSEGGKSCKEEVARKSGRGGVRKIKVARRRRESQLGFVCAVAVAGWRDYVDVHAARALHFKSLKSSLGGEKLVE